jgi:hypothetical protein
MAANPTRLTHKIAIQLHLVAESCTICSSRSRRPVRKLLDTPRKPCSILKHKNIHSVLCDLSPFVSIYCSYDEHCSKHFTVYHITKLTPWSRVLFWEADSHSASQFPIFHGSRRLSLCSQNTATDRYSGPKLIKSTTLQPLFVKFMLVLSSHLLLRLPSGLFPAGFPTKYCISHPSHARYIRRLSNSRWLYKSKNTWRSVQVMKLLIMQSSPASHRFLPLRSKYSPQHPVLTHPQYMLFP